MHVLVNEKRERKIICTREKEKEKEREKRDKRKENKRATKRGREGVERKGKIVRD